MFLKGNFLYTPSRTELTIRENQYAHIENGIVTGFTTSLPESAGAEKVIDYGQDIIIPAFVDLHIHAPQYINRGLGFDEELLPWLEHYTFPAEGKFADPVFAVTLCRPLLTAKLFAVRGPCLCRPPWQTAKY